MLVVTNPAFYKFVWHDGSPYVEIFRPNDPEYAPFEAVRMEGSFSKENLNRLANETPEYSRLI